MGLFGKVSTPIGMDISSNTIKVVQLKPYSPKPIIIDYAQAIVEGAVTDGEVTDVTMVAKAISDLWRASKIPEKRVILGVSNQKVIVRLISMPEMKEDELKSAIEFQAQDHIQITENEAIIDFQIVGEYTNEDNEKMIEVVLVAAQKDMIANHIKALEKAKLKPYIVDLSSFSLVRSLIEPPPIVPEEKDLKKAKEAVGLINIGEEITNIVIAENHVPRFTRVTSVADSTFIKTIADNMAIDLEKAEKLKNKFGFPTKKAVKIKKADQEKAQKVKSIMEEEAIRFISEIKRSFDYALSESVKKNKIDRIIITGKGSLTPNIIEQMKESFSDSKIEFGNPLISVDIEDEKDFEKISPNYSISVGLALRGLEE